MAPRDRAAREPTPFSRYVTSTKNIVGCTFALGGPVLALTGVLAPPIGLALTPVFYAVGAVATPRRKKEKLVAGLDPNDVRRSLGHIQRRIAGRVPNRIAGKVTTISNTITDVLPRADALGPGSPGQFVLVQCATDYLPTALQAYLDLPRMYADHKVVTDDGKTPLALLADQLDLLRKEIEEIADAINRADADRLLVNGRFLADKFGHSELDLGNAPESLPPPNPGTPGLPPPGNPG